MLLDYVLISPEGSNDRFAYVIVVDIPSSFTEDSAGEREFFYTKFLNYLHNSQNCRIFAVAMASPYVL